MPASADRIDPARLDAALTPCATPWRIELRQSCASSNEELLAAADAGAAHGRVLVCERQTAGRGRRGRRWESLASGSLTFSVLWRLAAEAPPPMGLSLAVGLALARAFEALGARDIALKWPNDVLGGGGKLAGILIELSSAGARPQAAVIGIGINIALPPEFAIDSGLPVSDLARVSVAPPQRERVLTEVLRALDTTLCRFVGEGFAPLRDAWMRRHAYAGAEVCIGGETATPIVGRCEGVDEQGALIIGTAAGPRRILSGDLSLRRRP